LTCMAAEHDAAAARHETRPATCVGRAPQRSGGRLMPTTPAGARRAGAPAAGSRPSNSRASSGVAGRNRSEREARRQRMLGRKLPCGDFGLERVDQKRQSAFDRASTATRSSAGATAIDGGEAQRPPRLAERILTRQASPFPAALTRASMSSMMWSRGRGAWVMPVTSVAREPFGAHVCARLHEEDARAVPAAGGGQFPRVVAAGSAGPTRMTSGLACQRVSRLLPQAGGQAHRVHQWLTSGAGKRCRMSAVTRYRRSTGCVVWPRRRIWGVPARRRRLRRRSTMSHVLQILGQAAHLDMARLADDEDGQPSETKHGERARWQRARADTWRSTRAGLGRAAVPAGLRMRRAR